MQTTSHYRCNKRLQRLPKKLINAFVIFVNVYYFNERQVKRRKANSGAFSGVYFVVTLWEWILLTAAWTKWNSEFARTAITCNKKFTNRLKKMSTFTFASVCYFFMINAFTSVAFISIFRTFNTSMLLTTPTDCCGWCIQSRHIRLQIPCCLHRRRTSALFDARRLTHSAHLK